MDSLRPVYVSCWTVRKYYVVRNLVLLKILIPFLTGSRREELKNQEGVPVIILNVDILKLFECLIVNKKLVVQWDLQSSKKSFKEKKETL